MSLTQCKVSYTVNLLSLVSFLLGFQFLTGILSYLSSQLTTGSRSLREESCKTELVGPPPSRNTLLFCVCIFFSVYADTFIFTIGNDKSVPISPSYCGTSLPYHRPICLVASHTEFYLKMGDIQFLQCNQQHCTGGFLYSGLDTRSRLVR